MNNPTDYAAVSKDEVNRRLAIAFNWAEVHNREEGLGGRAGLVGLSPDADYSKGLYLCHVPDYCADSAPVSLRAEMVDAVEEAGQDAVDRLGRMAQDYIKSQPPSRYLLPILLTVPQHLLARWVLAALESAQGGERR